MSYVKLFINVTKKQTIKENLNSELEKRISEIFKEPLEDLFDKPDLIRENFDIFYNYSMDYYNNLLNKSIEINSDQLDIVISFVVNTDKNNETEYYKNLFLLEFLSTKAV